MVGLFPRGPIEQAIKFVVCLGILVPHLGLGAKDIVVNQFA